MNKPLKLLLVVAVLAFAASGLYYAIGSGRPGKSETKLTRQDQSTTPKFDAGNTLPPTVVVGKEPAGSWPSPLPSEKPSVPVSTQAVATPNAASPAAAAPAGFSPAAEPMKPLPSTLPGFEPVHADGTTAKAAPANAISPGSPAPNLAPATPVGGSAAPASGAATVTARPAPAASPAPTALPPLPAPTKPAVAPAPSNPAPSAAPTTKAASADTYTVKEGDSIASIWRSISGSERGWEKMLAANPGVDPSRLKIGQVLKVPDHKATATAESTTAAASKPAAAAGSYTVQSGDTLSRIAAKTLGDSKRWKEIYDANRDTLGNDPGALEVGQSLKIPGKGGAPKPAASKPADAKPVETKPAPAPAPVAPPAGVIGGSPTPSTSPSPATTPAPTSTPAPR